MRGPGSKIIIRRPCDLTSAGETVSLICSSITDGPVTLLCARIKLALSDRRFAAHLVKGFPFLLEKSGIFFNGFLKIKSPVPFPPNISDSYMQHIFCAGRVLHRKNIIFKRYLSRSSLGRLRFNWGHPTYHANVIKLKWEIIWTGGLPYLSGVVSPTWGPPSPCKQSLRQSLYRFEC